MAVRLRPHHLLCVLTYSGKGYSPAFTENFDRIAARLAGGEAVSLVQGPDDVCAGWADAPEAHCRNASITVRDEAAIQALQPLLGPLKPGAALLLSPALVTALRSAFQAGAIRRACHGCEWADFCTAIADSGFGEARLP